MGNRSESPPTRLKIFEVWYWHRTTIQPEWLRRKGAIIKRSQQKLRTGKWHRDGHKIVHCRSLSDVTGLLTDYHSSGARHELVELSKIRIEMYQSTKNGGEQ